MSPSPPNTLAPPRPPFPSQSTETLPERSRPPRPPAAGLVARALARRRAAPNSTCEYLEAHRDRVAASLFSDLHQEPVHPRLDTPELAPYRSTFAAIGMALRASFCAADRERFRMLGVFPEHAPVPELLLRRAWNFPDPADDANGEDLCRSLLRAFHQAVRSAPPGAAPLRSPRAVWSGEADGFAAALTGVWDGPAVASRSRRGSSSTTGGTGASPSGACRSGTCRRRC